MAAAKWFDLMDLNSKLERVGDGFGGYTLHLELDAMRLAEVEEADLLDLGWVVDKDTSLAPGANGEPRAKLENLRPMTRAREVGEVLSLFFSAEELKSAYVTQDTMRQAERLDGLQERVRIGSAELAEVIEDVSPEFQSRIRAAVERSIAQVEQRRAKAAYIPFSGQGRAIYDLLTPALTEATGAPEDVAARFVLDEMANAAKEAGALREHLDNMAQAIGQQDAGQLQAEGEWLTANLSEGLGHLVAAIQRKLADRDMKPWSEENKWERVAEAIWGWNGTALVEAAEAGRVRDLVFEAIWEHRGLSAQSAVDVRYPLSERQTKDSIAARVPFKVKADNSIPTQVMANHLAAIERAMQFVGHQLGRRGDDVIPEQRSVPLRFTYGKLTSNGNVKGQMQSIRVVGDDGRKEGADEAEEGRSERTGLSIGVSIRAPYTFLHELGHAIDHGNNLSDVERRAIIEASGALGDIEGRIEGDHGRDSDYGVYLLSDSEVFARLFASAMQQACVEAGDPAQTSVGGWMSNTYWHPYAGTNVAGSGERFLTALRESLDARREAKKEVVVRKSPEAAPQNDYEERNERVGSRFSAPSMGG